MICKEKGGTLTPSSGLPPFRQQFCVRIKLFEFWSRELWPASNPSFLQKCEWPPCLCPIWACLMLDSIMNSSMRRQHFWAFSLVHLRAPSDPMRIARNSCLRYLKSCPIFRQSPAASICLSILVLRSQTRRLKQLWRHHLKRKCV